MSEYEFMFSQVCCSTALQYGQIFTSLALLWLRNSSVKMGMSQPTAETAAVVVVPPLAAAVVTGNCGGSSFSWSDSSNDGRFLADDELLLFFFFLAVPEEDDVSPARCDSRYCWYASVC